MHATVEVKFLKPETVHLATCPETAKAMLGIPGTVIVTGGTEMPVGLITSLATFEGVVFGGTVIRIVGA